MIRKTIFTILTVFILTSSVDAGGSVAWLVEDSDMIATGTVSKGPLDFDQKYRIFTMYTKEVLKSGAGKNTSEEIKKILVINSTRRGNHGVYIFEKGEYLLFLKKAEVEFGERTSEGIKKEKLEKLPVYSVEEAFLLSIPEMLPAYKRLLESGKKEERERGKRLCEMEVLRLGRQYGILVEDYVKAVREFIKLAEIENKFELLEKLYELKGKGKVYSESVDSYIYKFKLSYSPLSRKRIENALESLADKNEEAHLKARKELIWAIDNCPEIFERLMLYYKWQALNTKEESIRKVLDEIVTQGIEFGLTESLLKEIRGIFNMITSPREQTRMWVLQKLAKSENPEVAGPLRKLMEDESADIREEAKKALMKKGLLKDSEESNSPEK